MTVRVVLDTSALVAYSQLDGGVAVGELVAIVGEEGGASLVGIPAACFLSAFSVLSPEDRPRLVNLATTIDGPTTILPLLGIDTVEVAEMGSRLPEQSAAHAIIETRKMGASLATYLGRVARTELPDDAVLDLGP